MIAKIIQGTDFNGVINYMFNKPDDKAKVLAATGVRIALANNIAHDFNLQASMRPNVQKAVCHTILSFSANDAERLTDAMMVKIATETYSSFLILCNSLWILQLLYSCCQ